MKRSNVAATAKALVGRPVVARLKNGSEVSGTLVRVSGDRLYVAPRPAAGKRKAARTKALLPLLLYDVALIGAGVPYAYGPYGPYGPYNPYGPYSVPQDGFWF